MLRVPGSQRHIHTQKFPKYLPPREARLACTRDWVSSLRLSGKHCRHKGRYTLHIIPWVQVKRLVAATCCGDTSHEQIAFCVLEKFCEKLCLCYRILLRQQVTQVLSDLIFCNKLLWQNSPVHAKQFVAAMCRCEMLLQLVTSCVPTLKPWPCLFFNCSNFRFLMWILICDSF